MMVAIYVSKLAAQYAEDIVLNMMEDERMRQNAREMLVHVARLPARVGSEGPSSIACALKPPHARLRDSAS